MAAMRGLRSPGRLLRFTRHPQCTHMVGVILRRLVARSANVFEKAKIEKDTTGLIRPQHVFTAFVIVAYPDIALDGTTLPHQQALILASSEVISVFDALCARYDHAPSAQNEAHDVPIFAATLSPRFCERLVDALRAYLTAFEGWRAQEPRDKLQTLTQQLCTKFGELETAATTTIGVAIIREIRYIHDKLFCQFGDRAVVAFFNANPHCKRHLQRVDPEHGQQDPFEIFMRDPSAAGRPARPRP